MLTDHTDRVPGTLARCVSLLLWLLAGAAGAEDEAVLLWLRAPAATRGAVRRAALGERPPRFKRETPAGMPLRTRPISPSFARTALEAPRRRVRAAWHAYTGAWLDRAGIASSRVLYRFDYAPAVVVVPTPAQRAWLTRHPDVRRVFRNPDRARKELSVTVPAMRGFSVRNDGYSGRGVTVAHIEVEPGRIANPHVPATVYRPEGALSAHATAVGGIIRNAFPGYRALAFRCNLLSVNPPDASKAAWGAAVDWAVASGAAVLNSTDNLLRQTNTLHWSDIYADYLVADARVLFTKSAGNNSGAPDADTTVTSPGRGFNVLTVGNIKGQKTVTWHDDYMNGTSNYGNPATGVEKPEIAAYGSQITGATTNAPWVAYLGAGGTSYAAPQVAAVAALCIEAMPFLAGEPEALKALIMVSGLAHNIEGPAVPTNSPAARDGAGMALATAPRAGVAVFTLDNASFDGDGLYEVPVDIPLTGGDPKRVVLVYSHHPGAPDAVPDAASYDRCDLDLRLDVDDEPVAASAYSIANPFEVLDVVPVTSAVARARISRAAWDDDVGALRMGLAWASLSTLGAGPDRVATLLRLTQLDAPGRPALP
ncbi:MAG: S8 family serine peptidase [Lentisphaerae bacterium]|nr:S8 family serine peptidase [Lentisphaerota bacterium]